VAAAVVAGALDAVGGGGLDRPEAGPVRRFGVEVLFFVMPARMRSWCSGGRPPGRRDGALNEPVIRACLVSSQDRVCELNYGQVTLQGLKAVMIHDRSQ
jgi:hypothetical protein